MNEERLTIWKWVFWGMVAGYCLFYAPFGVNETDGGFLTGLAWQVLNGKVLYQDIVYVRPPLPVWLRAMELQVLPEHFAILGERWFFYGKLALYSWLGAAVVVGSGSSSRSRRWQLAVLGFVVSAHCYPPMAWHTVDGILFAVLGAYSLTYRDSGTGGWSLFAAGIFVCCAMACKQSFYPLLPLFLLYLLLEKANRWKNVGFFGGGVAASFALFFSYLYQNKLLSGFLYMTGSAASGGQALQHAVLDYFRITPELALPSLILLTPVFWGLWKQRNLQMARSAWMAWLIALPLSYAAITWLRQDHTVPFAQSRAVFWAAGLWFLAGLFRRGSSIGDIKNHRASLLLLGISWCASVSWGYNLPILFSTPMVWGLMEITRTLFSGEKAESRFKTWQPFAMLLLLVFAFRIGHEFVYRDGRRSEMNQSMGAIFPTLGGIYSGPETAALYLDLKNLAEKYGPNFKTLPAFPQANFLMNTLSPLPLDWVVNRETNQDNSLVFKSLKEKQPMLFIQKSFREKLDSDPELEVTRKVWEGGKVLEETPHFWVVSNYDL